VDPYPQAGKQTIKECLLLDPKKAEVNVREVRG
jgi:hypothetical protein